MVPKPRFQLGQWLSTHQGILSPPRLAFRHEGWPHRSLTRRHLSDLESEAFFKLLGEKMVGMEGVKPSPPFGD